jgi:hypothetical protein
MSRLLPLTGLAALLLPGCWRDAGFETDDTGWIERPGEGEPQVYPDDDESRSEFFSPNWWTLEIWGYYDGERLTDFQYNSSSSGAVPAFAIVRFTDPQWDDDEECYWAGLVKIQGWTVLTDTQYDAWGYTLEQTDTTCRDFDPAIWLEQTPTTIIESHYHTLGWTPPDAELEAALSHGTDGPMGWASRDDEAAVGLRLGFERELGTFEHFLGGAAYGLKTADDNTVVWSATGRPYPLDLNGDLEKHVIVGGSLDPLEVDLFF